MMSRPPCWHKRFVRIAAFSIAFIQTVSVIAAASHAKDIRPSNAGKDRTRQPQKNDGGVDIDISHQGRAFVAEPDPKRPGKYLWTLWSGPFSFQAPGGTGISAVQGVVKDVTATFYQNGVASAEMKAPEARGDNVQSAVVASGGVTVKSLIDIGTSIRADTVTWYATQNKVVASGHVHYVNGRTKMVIQAPVVVGDTMLRTIRSPRPGEMTMPLTPATRAR
jgi:hypothetical protein